nr:unnamed protein product [Callosobruchus analis]
MSLILSSADVSGTYSLSGDSGKALLNRIKNLIGDFSYPDVAFFFPTAENIPYTQLEGEFTRAWFDQWNTTPDVPEIEEHLEEATLRLEGLISMVRHCFPCVPSPYYKTIIGGFGMGGTLALTTAYYGLPYELSGVFVLSSYLNYDSKVYKLEDEFALGGAPLYMCHGDKDEVLPIEWGKETFDSLRDGS